jgi:hypothetical protein
MTRVIHGCVATLLVVFVVPAHSADVDWKVYGFASVAGAEVCFYEDRSVVRAPNGFVRVWTKCLSQKDMDGIDAEHDFEGKILENSARKIVRLYHPPFSWVEESVDYDKATMITIDEEIANIAGVKPHTSIFYELNCSQRMLRELSMTIEINGQHHSSETPSQWHFVPPEGNGAWLLKILCTVLPPAYQK